MCINRPTSLRLAAAVLLACVFLWLASLTVRFAFGAVPYRQDSLDQALELAGTFVARVAMLLLIRLRHEKNASHLFWVVLALLAMGSVDAIYTMVQFGWAWSWLRHGSTFIGGLLFGLVWIPFPTAVPRRTLLVASAVTLLPVCGSFAVWYWGATLPAPRVGGHYSFGAEATNALGGLGFFAAHAQEARGA